LSEPEPAREAIPTARDAARKALQFDLFEPRAHLTMCAVAASHDYDWKQVKEHYLMALAVRRF